MRSNQWNRRRAFSLIELVIVVVIIGIIGAIAIPRMSRGAAGASDSALTANLAVMRNAIDLYATEHGGTFPTFASFNNQMLTYTDDIGNTNAAPTPVFIYGPYLRSIPPLPVGTNKGLNSITNTLPYGTDPDGWYYDETTGDVRANCAAGEDDAKNVDYNTY